jgi:hypothetical protein
VWVAVAVAVAARTTVTTLHVPTELEGEDGETDQGGERK